MLRISKLTDYATVILSQMARNSAVIHATAELASSTGIAQPTVSKILKQLTHASIVHSIRGAQGGYRLSDTPEKISVAQIISSMEGPLGITECCSSESQCDQASHCHISGNWGLINRALETTLQAISLADLVHPAASMSEIKISVDPLTATQELVK